MTPSVGVERVTWNHRARRQARLTRLGPRRTSTGTLRRIAVPLFTWDPCRLSSLLSRLCPPSEDQIAPDVPKPFLQLLATNSYDHVTTFDENDVLLRLQPLSSIPCFPWDTEAEWRRALANPAVARQYLDVVHEMRRRGSLDVEDTLAKNVHLPDRDCVARPLGSMYRAVDLPPMLGERETTALVHPDVLAHPLLKSKAWMPATFRVIDIKSSLIGVTVCNSIPRETHRGPARVASISSLVSRNACGIFAGVELRPGPGAPSGRSRCGTPTMTSRTSSAGCRASSP